MSSPAAITTGSHNLGFGRPGAAEPTLATVKPEEPDMPTIEARGYVSSALLYLTKQFTTFKAMVTKTLDEQGRTIKKLQDENAELKADLHTLHVYCANSENSTFVKMKRILEGDFQD